ncbi:MAG TPA: hypothetical protein VI837_13545 [Blastocatellia bacterium]|nr:hypothetical protein [Blastocatellia bacterium]
MNPKFPGGVAGQVALLKAEGHKLVTRGKKTYVADYDRHLAKLNAPSHFIAERQSGG